MYHYIHYSEFLIFIVNQVGFSAHFHSHLAAKLLNTNLSKKSYAQTSRDSNQEEKSDRPSVRRTTNQVPQSAKPASNLNYSQKLTTSTTPYLLISYHKYLKQDYSGWDWWSLVFDSLKEYGDRFACILNQLLQE